MNRQELIEKIREVIEREDNLTSEMLIEQVEELDSLGFLNVTTLFDELFEIQVGTEQLEDCKTVDDIIAIVSAKLDG